MPRRKLEELNLLDDFLFGSMVTYPEIGEKFMRELLKVIFQRDFGKLKVIPQKVYYGSNTDKHGARLDVYLEEPEPCFFTQKEKGETRRKNYASCFTIWKTRKKKMPRTRACVASTKWWKQ